MDGRFPMQEPMYSPPHDVDPRTTQQSVFDPERALVGRPIQAVRRVFRRPHVRLVRLQHLHWCARGGLLAGGVGFGLTLVDPLITSLLARQRFVGTTAPAWWQSLVAALVVASGYAVVALAVSLVATVRRGTHRVSASLLVGGVVAVLFAFHAFGLTTRVLTGSFLTMGTVEFALACESSVLAAVFSDFAGLLVGLAVCTCAVAAAVSWHLLRRPACPGKMERRRVGLVGIVVAPAFLYGSATLAAPSAPLVTAVSQCTPELAFLASLEPLDDETWVSADDAFRYVLPEGSRVGPPRSRGDAWRDVVRELSGEPRPNVLLLVLESLPASHVGYSGYPRRVTPRLDALASRSVRMRRVWATATHSNYAQMAILSSLFPRRGHGLDLYERLDYPRVLIHDVFHLLDYRTATFSSQDEDWQGMRRFQSTETPTTFWHSDDHPGPHIRTSSDKAVPDAITVDKFIEWVRQGAGARWSAYVNLQSTHFPYRLPRGAPMPFQPTGPIEGPYHYFHYDQRDRAMIVNRYDNALRHVDAQVGRIEQFLEQSRQLDDTLWVITGDHGELFAERGIVTHGRTLREGELRVPLLLHWPRKLVPQDVDEPVSHLDVLPTLLELVGVPAHPAFQGTSFARLGRHREVDRAIFFNIQGQRLVEGVLCWPWKLIVPRSSQKPALFDLIADPKERTDLAAKEPRLVAVLSELLQEHVRAQIEYHQEEGVHRNSFYAPRLLRCPAVLARDDGERHIESHEEFWQR